MIDAARALAANATATQDAASHLADLVLREIERLDALHVALMAFIEQPGPVSAEGVEAMSGGALPAPSPRPAGRPTPVSQPPAGETAGGRKRPASTTPPAVSLACPHCSFVGKTPNGLGVHVARSHKHLARGIPYPVTPADAPPTKADGKDPREIDEECPRGCGQRFRWAPTLNSHASRCDGRKAA